MIRSYAYKLVLNMFSTDVCLEISNERGGIKSFILFILCDMSSYYYKRSQIHVSGAR